MQKRSVHATCVRFLWADKSKLEETLKRLKEQAKLEEKEGLARKQVTANYLLYLKNSVVEFVRFQKELKYAFCQAKK